MAKIILSIIAVIYGINAFIMWFLPEFWYENTPGVAMMGPFNLHFIRDIALIYLLAAAAFVWALKNNSHTSAYVGAAWPCMHALFHIQIWMARGLPLDEIAVVNLTGIQLPAWGALYLIYKIFPSKE
jgi:hypothetical protein